MFLVRKLSKSLRTSKKPNLVNEDKLVPVVTTPSHQYDDARLSEDDNEEEEHKADEPNISNRMEHVKLHSDQLFDTSDHSNIDICVESMNHSDANSSFYTHGSGDFTKNSTKIATFTLSAFEQWKEQNMGMTDLTKLNKLLTKQCERYSVNMFDSLEAEDQPAIESLQNDQGFSFEEAVLYHFNAARGLKLPEPGKLSRKKSRQSMSTTKDEDSTTMSPVLVDPKVHHNAIANNSPSSTQSTVVTQPLPYMYDDISSLQMQLMTEEDVTAAAFYHHAQEKYIEAMEEEGQLRLSIMLSEQEEKCGWNMFDAMTSTEDFLTFRNLLQQGLLFEDAILTIYKQKYPSYLTPIHTVALSNTVQPSINPFPGHDTLTYGDNSILHNTFAPLPAPMPYTYNTSSSMNQFMGQSSGPMMMTTSFLPAQTPPMPMMMNNGHANEFFIMEPHQVNRRQTMSYRRHQSPTENRRKSSSSAAPRMRNNSSTDDRDGNGKPLKHHKHNGESHRNIPQNNHFDNANHYLASGLYRPGSNSNMQQSFSFHSSSSSMAPHQSFPPGAALFPTSQPPSRIPSRQSMMSRSTSSHLNSRSASFSRSNSSTGNDLVHNGKMPALEPVRQDSPTRRQINRR